MADKMHVVEVFPLQHVSHVDNVRVETDIRRRQMRSLAEPGVSRSDETMATRRHQRMHLLPGPSHRPGAMSHHERRHEIEIPYFAAAVCIGRRSLLRRDLMKS